MRGRGRTFKVSTRHDNRQHRPADLVDREFGGRPDPPVGGRSRLVKTHSGSVYAAFIIDVYSGMVVGCQFSKSLHSQLAIDALEMAVWNRTRAG